MKMLGFVLGWLMSGLFRLTYTSLAFTGKTIGRGVVPLTTALGRKAIHERRARRADKQETVRIRVLVPEEEAKANTGPATIIHASDFEIADRIVSIRLDPPVGVINLRIYKSLAKVERDLIISEPQLASMMQGRRHSLSSVSYDPVEGLDGIKEQTIQEVEKLINDLGSRPVSAHRPKKDEFERTAAPAPGVTAPAAIGLAPQQGASQVQQETTPIAPAVARTTAASQRPHQPQGQAVAPKVNKGFTYVGELVRAGAQAMRPSGRAAYEVFEATLKLDNGAELALRGAELERELMDKQCQVGQRVAITPMGKVPVTLGDGSEGSKNLYRVQRVGGAF